MSFWTERKFHGQLSESHSGELFGASLVGLRRVAGLGFSTSRSSSSPGQRGMIMCLNGSEVGEVGWLYGLYGRVVAAAVPVAAR